jgi:arylformamidase
MIYDISPAVAAGMPVWPGDTGPQREILGDLRRGDDVNLSTLRTTVHVGAHVDAPSHMSTTGLTIDECDLERFIGPAEVLRVTVAPGEAIQPRHLRGSSAPRVLLATGTYGDWGTFRSDFAALSVAAVEELHARGVVLVGIDTPSVDLFGATNHPVHERMNALDMAVLEGLDLSGVPEGVYELVALPLKLVGFEASPVRAILRT